MKAFLVKKFQKFLILVEKFSIRIYLLVINIVFILVRSPVYISYCEKNLRYFAFDKSLKKRFFFLIPSRATGFIRGFNTRFKGISSNYLLDDLNFSHEDLVIDVGANIGDLKGYLNINGFGETRYHAFEPSKEEFDTLKLNAQSSKLNNIGCWNESGTREFFISSENADSSFERPSSKIESIEIMRVTRLDEIYNEKIKLLKMDGEGCELEILEGCADIFRHIEYISVDAGYERGIDNLCTFPEVSNILYSNGFFIEKFQARGRVCGLFKNSNYP